MSLYTGSLVPTPLVLSLRENRVYAETLKRKLFSVRCYSRCTVTMKCFELTLHFPIDICLNCQKEKQKMEKRNGTEEQGKNQQKTFADKRKPQTHLSTKSTSMCEVRSSKTVFI